ncbi:MAG: hypothetical protein R3Y24_03115 [Eubacteriales bacterium]
MKLRKLVAMYALIALTAVTLMACGGETEEAVTEEVATEEVAEEAVTEEVVTEEVAEFIQVPVTIINGTGVDITELYVSGETQEDWGDEQLAGQVMGHGQYLDLVLNVDVNNLLWDICVADAEGTTIEFYGLDITEMPADGFAIELLFDGTEATATVEADVAAVAADYVTSEETEGDVVAEDISYSIAGTVWVDDELNVYGFETDEQTLYLTLSDGSEYTGIYALWADTEGTIALSMAIPDVDVQIDAVVTDMGEDYIEFTDIESGASSVLVPVE